MTRHPRRCVPAILVALVVLAACVVTAISVIQQLAGRAPLLPLADIGRHVRTLHMNGTEMTTAGAVAAGLGLILLLCALLPGRPRTMALGAVPDEQPAVPGQRAAAGQPADLDASTAPAAASGTAVAVDTAPARTGEAAGVAPVAGVSRSGLRTALATTLADVDGVDAVRVRVRSRRVSARVRTELTTSAAVQTAASEAAGRRLDQAGLARRPEVRVSVQVRRKAAA